MKKVYVIPPARIRYLSEISENNRAYDSKVASQTTVAQKLYGIYKTLESVLDKAPVIGTNGLEIKLGNDNSQKQQEFIALVKAQFDKIQLDLDLHNWRIITEWQSKNAL